MSKYIIRNCPCFVEGIAIKGNEQKTQTCNNHKVRELTYCADITDCKLKQIVKNLKQVAYACHCDNCDGCGYYSGCGDTECGTYQALKSLELLDIQEVE
jgi:superfamily II DNA helicase RecQ